mmetsp:Transcript_3717/g.10909  ORF Transcript_3717/g.10909 Transcript_3717/m.10909 type:complete len:95 (-) Transcript_3717:712-996(-)
MTEPPMGMRGWPTLMTEAPAGAAVITGMEPMVATGAATIPEPPMVITGAALTIGAEIPIIEDAAPPMVITGAAAMLETPKAAWDMPASCTPLKT